ncbi:MAG TPA: hypothetical protein VE135_03675 [Pyrinomonadaceae bacterium]|nr:hypothetical protein [Pyrinomonadaceae bacterium]
MYKKNEQNLKKRLDSAARRIVESAALSEGEAQAIAASPFLFARIRNRIGVESAERTGVWANLGLESRRAIPVMALAAAVSLGLFLYINGNKSPNQTFSVDAYLGAGDSGIDSLVIAEKRLTDEDVLRTIVSRDDREAGK